MCVQSLFKQRHSADVDCVTPANTVNTERFASAQTANERLAGEDKVVGFGFVSLKAVTFMHVFAQVSSSCNEIWKCIYGTKFGHLDFEEEILPALLSLSLSRFLSPTPHFCRSHTGSTSKAHRYTYQINQQQNNKLVSYELIQKPKCYSLPTEQDQKYRQDIILFQPTR